MKKDTKTTENAPKRGGPKTKHGVEVIVLNPVRHGILSPNPVIPGMERKRDWNKHLKGVIESLQPEGHLERELAERVALNLWQLKRVTRHIVAVTSSSVDDVEIDFIHGVMLTHGVQNVYDAAAADRRGEAHDMPVPTPQHLASMRERRMVPPAPDLDKVMRYESHLHRLIDKTLRSLEALQAKRLGTEVRHVRYL